MVKEEAFLVGIRGKHLWLLLVHGKDQPSERLGQLKILNMCKR